MWIMQGNFIIFNSLLQYFFQSICEMINLFLIKYNIYIVAAFYNFINFENILTLKQSSYNLVDTVTMHNKVTYVRSR
jgi:hypothetical protein